MKHMNGVRLLSLESNDKKQSVSAIDYSKEVIAEEVDSQFTSVHEAGMRKTFTEIELALVDFLNQTYKAEQWEKVLWGAGLEKATKKEAETFLNSYATLLVAPCAIGLFQECWIQTHSIRTRGLFRRVTSELRDVGGTAKELLTRYGVVSGPPDLWETFRTACYGQIDRCYKSLK